MRYILFTLILALSTPAIGQRHFVGIQSGVNLATIDQRPFSHGRVAFSGGFTYDYKLIRNLALSSGILLNPRGFHVEETLVRPEESYQTKLTSEYDYISIPLMVRYSGLTRIYPFVSLGLLPSMLIKAKGIFESSNVPQAHVSFDKTDIVSKVDLAGVMEAGAGFRMSRRLTLLAAASFHKSLTSTTETYKNAPAGLEKFYFKHKGMMFSVGLQLAISKSESSLE